jgi:peptidoglycan/xylan/chitin deacetylase (PgdA/CDA1 family)
VTGLLKRAGTLMLLPLSLVPFVLLGPQIAESHRNFDRVHKSAPLAAPPVALTAAERAHWQPVTPYTDAVPVLAYHGIDSRPGRDYRSVTRAAFARQMAMLDHAGFHPVSIEQYARFRAGDQAALPSRPVLITFDDGRLDSYRGAHRILQRHGFRATMFAITGKVRARDPFYLTWQELHRMERSGVWDVQPHAASGHRRVAVDRAGHMGDFYANRRYTASEGDETFAAWQTRVTREVFAARDALIEQGFEPVSFAVPAGNYGQLRSNDPRIAPFLRSLLGTQFGTVFVTDEDPSPPYSGTTGDAHRYLVRADASAESVYAWLRRENPAVAHAKRPHNPGRHR